jgi:hypothetical protein
MSYSQLFTDLGTQATEILSAFTDAGLQLQTSGVSIQVFYQEIYYDGGGLIRRRYDDTRVNALSNLEQLRLYPQLNGLFIEASKTVLYP